jgi:hypothetical protein
MLALGLNPSMDLEKLLGGERARMARNIVHNEIRVRGEQLQALEADGQEQPPPAKKARIVSTSIMDEVTDEFSLMADMPEQVDRDEAQAFFHCTPAQKSEGVRHMVDSQGRPTGRRFFDSLQFWGRMETEFPIACRVARAAYSVMATEANSERAFSAAGFTLNDYRTSLTTEHMQWLMTIERNQEFLPLVEVVKAAYLAA